MLTQRMTNGVKRKSEVMVMSKIILSNQSARVVSSADESSDNENQRINFLFWVNT